MGLFSRKLPPCDWCGAPIEGAGISDGASTLCSEACLQNKNAPPAAPKPAARERPSGVPSAGAARSELQIAVSETKLYEALLAAVIKGGVGVDPVELTARAHETYLGIWEHLDLVRAHLAGNGVATPEYDQVRAVSIVQTDAATRSISPSVGLGFGGLSVGVTTSLSVAVHPENAQKARYAVRVLHAQLGARGG